MSCLFDVFIRQYGSDAPLLTVTIDPTRPQDTSSEQQYESGVICDDSAESDEFTIFDLKRAIYQQGANMIIPERQQLYYQDIKLEFDHKPLYVYGIKAGSTVHVWDKGIQIPVRMEKFMAYTGPPLIWYLYSNYHMAIFEVLLGDQYLSLKPDDYLVQYREGPTQRLATYMIYGHFLKLAAETMLLNRLAGRMMPLNRAMWQFLYYWGGLGGIVGYSVFHPEYTPVRYVPDAEGEGGTNWFSTLAIILFVTFEIQNLQCHWHFSAMERNMAAAVLTNSTDKTAESRSRRSHLVASISKLVVLRDHGFSLVTCADWFWEFLSWICFTMVTQTFWSYCFLLTWFVWHNSKAQERHWSYIAEYRRDYPPERRAFLPYLF